MAKSFVLLKMTMIVIKKAIVLILPMLRKYLFPFFLLTYLQYTHIYLDLVLFKLVFGMPVLFPVLLNGPKDPLTGTKERPSMPPSNQLLSSVTQSITMSTKLNIYIYNIKSIILYFPFPFFFTCILSFIHFLML